MPSMIQQKLNINKSLKLHLNIIQGCKQNDYLSIYRDISEMKSLMEDSTIYSNNYLTQQLKIYNDIDNISLSQ